MAADVALDIPTVAERLGVGKKTVYRRIHAGEIKAVDIGKRGSGKTRLRVRETALRAYLDAREI